jgi:uncharacterized protein YhfF
MEPIPQVEDLAPKLRSYGIELPCGVARVGTFGDSEALCQELLSLIRSGRKRGGASLLWANEDDSEPVQSVGDVEIVMHHAQSPCLVTRVTAVQVVPFNGVTAAFAARQQRACPSYAAPLTC